MIVGIEDDHLVPGKVIVTNRDLRDWIGEVSSIGQLKVIKGAEPKQEIGGISTSINAAWANRP